MVGLSRRKVENVHRCLFEKKALAFDARQKEELRCLEFQGRLTEALLGYAGAITSAFEFLGQAHSALQMQGAADVDGTGLSEKMLFESFRDAHATVCYLAGTARIALDTSQATLQACAADLEKADEAAAQVERYNKQLQAFKSTDTASWRCKKIQAKMDPAVHLAGVHITRAQDSLKGCISRQGDLCQVARQLLAGTAAALRDAIGPLKPHGVALPREARGVGTAAEISIPPTPPAAESLAAAPVTIWPYTSAASVGTNADEDGTSATSGDVSTKANEDVNSSSDAADTDSGLTTSSIEQYDSPWKQMPASVDSVCARSDASTPTTRPLEV